MDDAELVFVGYGIQAPEYQWDDFKGVNLAGKILVMMNNDPDWDPNLFAGKRRLYYGRWDYKYESAARQGAAGAIIIHTTPSAGYPWQVVQSSWGGEQFELPAGNEPRLRVKAWATEDGGAAAARRRAATISTSCAPRRARATSSRCRSASAPRSPSPTRCRACRPPTSAACCPGAIRGSRRSWWCCRRTTIISASASRMPAAIASTTARSTTPPAARRCSPSPARSRRCPQRPRRSVLALFVAAEERGLLGSMYYAEHPSVPAGRIAADINIDGGNIFGRTRDATLDQHGQVLAR